ncbi:MAG: Fur family transcriptional regulator [Chloroflexota bacterium]|jgi:Fur family transcriptional regulator, ferric uptake regulator
MLLSERPGTHKRVQMDKQRFREFLSAKGFKSTRERDEIITEILDSEGHFNLDDLFLRLRAKGSKVSRASIYRTIPLLVESGLIEEVERGDKRSNYERVSSDSHHDHMICIRCGKVIEFFSPALESLQDELCTKESFTKVKHHMEILGYCAHCAE